MFKVRIYEEESYEYYTNDFQGNYIELDIENYQDLTKIIEIALKSNHSIEICKVDEKEN